MNLEEENTLLFLLFHLEEFGWRSIWIELFESCTDCLSILEYSLNGCGFEIENVGNYELNVNGMSSKFVERSCEWWNVF